MDEEPGSADVPVGIARLWVQRQRRVDGSFIPEFPVSPKDGANWLEGLFTSAEKVKVKVKAKVKDRAVKGSAGTIVFVSLKYLCKSSYLFQKLS